MLFNKHFALRSTNTAVRTCYHYEGVEVATEGIPGFSTSKPKMCQFSQFKGYFQTQYINNA